MENILIEKTLGSFMPHFTIEKLAEGSFCEKETPDGLMYYKTETDENGQLYYSYGCWIGNVWNRPSRELIYEYFRIDLVDCLLFEKQGAYPTIGTLMAISSDDMEKKIMPDMVWS